MMALVSDRGMNGRVTSLVLVVLLLLVGLTHAQGPVAATASKSLPTLAITSFESQGLGNTDIGAIRDNLISKLQQTGRYRVLERSQMEQILKEQGFQNSGVCDGSDCAVEMGKLLGIQQMVVGSAGVVGNTYTLNLRLVDVTTGEALSTSARNRKGTIDDVLIHLVPAAVADLSGDRALADRLAVAGTRRPLWPWLVGGVAVAGGGVAAVLLLGGSEGKPATAAPVSNDSHLVYTW
jgi:hypothetical protein